MPTPVSESKSPPAGPTNPALRNAFVGRQPVFDKQQNVVCYELLFRDGAGNFCPQIDGNQATRSTVHTSLNLLGLEELSGGKPVLINLTRDLLLNEFYTVLPPQRAIVELLETVPPEPEVIKACRALKDSGYRLALDDFVLNESYEPLIELADIIKIDFMSTQAADCRSIVRKYGNPRLSFLAEKVETQEQHHDASDMGYNLFQGYFFCKPQILKTTDVAGAKRNCMKFLQEITRPKLDFDSLEEALKQEPTLSVKLLKYLQSSAVAVRQKVTSIRQALTLLGERPLRQWGALVAMSFLGEDKPLELIRVSLARGRFCELIGQGRSLGGHDLDLFLLGLLSALDALLDRPMLQVLSELPMSIEIRDALLGTDGPLSKLPLLIQACERCDTKRLGMLTSRMQLREDAVLDIHSRSLRWADEVLRS